MEILERLLTALLIALILAVILLVFGGIAYLCIWLCGPLVGAFFTLLIWTFITAFFCIGDGY